MDQSFINDTIKLQLLPLVVLEVMLKFRDVYRSEHMV